MRVVILFLLAFVCAAAVRADPGVERDSVGLQDTIGQSAQRLLKQAKKRAFFSRLGANGLSIARIAPGTQPRGRKELGW